MRMSSSMQLCYHGNSSSLKVLGLKQNPKVAEKHIDQIQLKQTSEHYTYELEKNSKIDLHFY